MQFQTVQFQKCVNPICKRIIYRCLSDQTGIKIDGLDVHDAHVSVDVWSRAWGVTMGLILGMALPQGRGIWCLECEQTLPVSK